MSFDRSNSRYRKHLPRIGKKCPGIGWNFQVLGHIKWECKKNKPTCQCYVNYPGIGICRDDKYLFLLRYQYSVITDKTTRNKWHCSQTNLLIQALTLVKAKSLSIQDAAKDVVKQLKCIKSFQNTRKTKSYVQKLKRIYLVQVMKAKNKSIP